MRTCYGCKHLSQGGDGMNVCIAFDPYEEGGTILLDDMPVPLYSDCWAAIESE